MKPKHIENAIAAALKSEDREFSETRWSEIVFSSQSGFDWAGKRIGNRFVDSKCVTVQASAQHAFAPIRRIGGKNGWYYAQWLWNIRGAVDFVIGGVGLRRGRREPDATAVGEIIDFWRVEVYEPDRRLRLAAEMKLPGRAWLEFEVVKKGAETVIWQTAIFDPIGICGLIYWHALYPIHQIIFRGMLRKIAKHALVSP